MRHAEAIVIAASHKEFEGLTPKLLKDYGVEVVVDGRNMLRNRKPSLESAGIIYKGIGT